MYVPNKKRVRHSKLLAFWAVVLCVASLSSIGFASWVAEEGSAVNGPDINVQVGDIDSASWLTHTTTTTFQIYQTGFMNSEDDSLFTTSPQVKLYFTTDTNYVAGKQVELTVNYVAGAPGTLSSYFTGYSVVINYAIVTSGGSTTSYSSMVSSNTGTTPSNYIAPSGYIYLFEVIFTFTVSSDLTLAQYNTIYGTGVTKTLSFTYDSKLI